MRLEEEIRAFDDDVKKLGNLASFMTKAAAVHKVSEIYKQQKKKQH